MDVILLERIEKLGAIGDVVKVKNGYARNFLLPSGKALRANESNRKVFEANREKIEAQQRRAPQRGRDGRQEGRRRQGPADPPGLEHRPALRLGLRPRPRRGAGGAGPQGRQEPDRARPPDQGDRRPGREDRAPPGGVGDDHVNVARSPEEAELQAQGIDVMAEMFEKDVAGFTEERDRDARAGRDRHLYGSVSARDLAEALEAQGHKIAKHQIVLDKPIKALGVQDVKIALHPEVSVTISVNVARSPEEAELQAQGKDVMAEMFEKDVSGFIEETDAPLEPGEVLAEPEAEPEAAPAAEPAAEEIPAEEAPEAPIPRPPTLRRRTRPTRPDPTITKNGRPLSPERAAFSFARSRGRTANDVQGTRDPDRRAGGGAARDRRLGQFRRRPDQQPAFQGEAEPAAARRGGLSALLADPDPGALRARGFPEFRLPGRRCCRR